MMTGHAAPPWPRRRRPPVTTTRHASYRLLTTNKVHRRLCTEEQRDRDEDGVPEVYQYAE
jgi:hypothetical protein